MGFNSLNSFEELFLLFLRLAMRGDFAAMWIACPYEGIKKLVSYLICNFIVGSSFFNLLIQ